MAYVDSNLNDSSLYFNTVVYSGDGGSTQNITNTFQTDLSWIKHRSTTAAHTIQDSTRGFDVTKKLSSNTGEDENNTDGATWENYGGVTAVSSTNFTVSLGSHTPYQTNASGVSYVAWNWKESATAGFDIVAYTGNATSRTISHSLSAVPHFIIIKNRSADDSWVVGHHQLGDGDWNDSLRLEESDAITDETTFNDTTPTSSVFSVDGSNNVNRDTSSFIAYVWRSVQGFSKFGSYTGNGNADGPFIYTGFRPAFIMFKKTDTADGWAMFDNKRNEYNVVNKTVEANVNYAEYTGDRFDIVSNGFKQRSNNGVNNSSGGTYVYIAFAEAPFVNSNGVPCNAR